MGLLRDNQQEINSAKGKLANILQILENVDETAAKMYFDWMHKKALLYKAGKNIEPYQPLPNGMERGDIVMCELGINITPEFGNDGTGNHYVMIWGQQGHNFIVLPITKQCPPKSNIHTIELGHIDGMPEKTNYMKLDAIRTVSIRRIGKMYRQPEGKIKAQYLVKQVTDAMHHLFILSEKERELLKKTD